MLNFVCSQKQTSLYERTKKESLGTIREPPVEFSFSIRPLILWWQWWSVAFATHRQEVKDGEHWPHRHSSPGVSGTPCDGRSLYTEFESIDWLLIGNWIRSECTSLSLSLSLFSSPPFLELKWGLEGEKQRAREREREWISGRGTNRSAALRAGDYALLPLQCSWNINVLHFSQRYIYTLVFLLLYSIVSCHVGVLSLP